MKYVTLAFLALCLFGCPKPPLNPGVPDPTPLPDVPKDDPEGLATHEGKACENMRKLACSDGLPDKKGRTCFQTLIRVEADHVIVPLTCLENAGNINILRACGDDNTLRVRCP